MQAWQSGFGDVLLGDVVLKGNDPVLGFVSMAGRTLAEDLVPNANGCGWRMGRLRDGPAVQRLSDVQCDMRSPFESCEMIAGGIVGRFDNDALLKLRFAAETVDLAMHTHEHSRRVLMAVEGSGFFHVSTETLASFSGRHVHSVAVNAGDIIAFDKDVVHTFSAPIEALTLLSFHAPFIPLDDAWQYTLPDRSWFPPLMMTPGQHIA